MSQTRRNELPKRAMVLSAGEGRRMRPLTERLPKPLIEVRGCSMIDHVLDKLAAAGIEEAVVNLLHLGELLRAHLADRKAPRIVYSEETDLLETGGGVTKALPLLGDAPFFVVNGDIHWLDGTISALRRLADTWRPDAMDALLLLHPTVSAHGYDGPGDFWMDQMGALSFPPECKLAPFVFAGLQVLSPTLFQDCRVERFPLRSLYHKAAEAGRLYGLRHQGEWFHVGTPEQLSDTEAILEAMGFSPERP